MNPLGLEGPRRRRWKFLLALAVIITFSLAGVLYFYRGRNAVTVRVARLARGDMAVTFTATATGAVESEAEVKVSSQAVGRLERLLAKEGDYVKAGQRIALLDRKEALAQLELARANLEAARARLAQAETGLPLQRTEVETQIAQARANWEEADRNLKRSQELYNLGAISRQQLDLAILKEEVARADLEAALARRAQDAIKEKEVAAARATVKQMEASLSLAETQLGYTTILAPISGRVLKEWAKEGELMTVGTPVFTLIDESKLYIRATIDEYDARRLRVGLPAVVTFDAYPRRSFKGRIYHISPGVSGARQEVRTFTIKVSLERDNPPLRPGMSADVEVIAAELKGVLFISTQAVIEREGRKWVYVVEDGHARFVPIDIGESNWNYTEIKGGVREGGLIVLNPDTPNLKDGAGINIKEGP